MKPSLGLLRCPNCRGELRFGSRDEGLRDVDSLECLTCGAGFPIIDDIPRMVTSPTGKAIATAESFGFEWQRFPEMYPEWERNFLAYVAPRGPEFFRGKRVLDAGCGAGRHAFYTARYGADVWALDLSLAIDVARRNVGSAGTTTFIQGDLEHLPFPPESFDFVYSLGVLHHSPDPEAAFRALVDLVKPGGEILVYVYWKPDAAPLKRALLGLVMTARRLTTRLPHSVTYAVAVLTAWLAFGFLIGPYKLLCGSPVAAVRRIAETIPLRQYAAYPFRVCVNDQFDRFSAPIEHRFTRAELQAWFVRAGLDSIEVRENWGWVGSGRKPR